MVTHCKEIAGAYLSLDHVDSGLSHLPHAVEHVHDSLATRPIQQIVQRYECPCTANPRAAVDDVRASQRCGAGGIVAAEFPVESEQGSRLHGNAVVRPGGEVQLTNCCRQTVLATIAATTSCTARGVGKLGSCSRASTTKGPQRKQ